MEALTEASEKHRIALVNLISKECSSYERVLKEDLARWDAALASEAQKQYGELEVLRQQAIRAERLEVENDELRRKMLLGGMRDQVSKKGSNGKSLPGPEPSPHKRTSEVYLSNTVSVASKQPCVTQEEYESLKSDYGKLVVSHKTLQEKYRRAKEISKAWREYDDKQKLRQVEKQRRTGLINDPRRIASPDSDRGHVESPQAPSFSNETIYTPRSILSVTPKPSSPTREVVSGTTQKQRPGTCDEKPTAHAEILGRSCTVKATAASAVSAYIGQGDVTQISDESTDPQVELQLTRKSPQAMGLGYRIPKNPQDDECLDCPVVISERPVKRKRHIAAAVKKEVIIHGDGAMPPGSVTKPIHVKSEKHSSSPVVHVVALEDPEVEQDTLDLDEVGDRALTPRKRRRLQQLRIRSQGFNQSSLTMTQSVGKQQVNGGYEEVRANLGTERDMTTGHENDLNDHNDPPLPRDRAYYMKLGEEHGIKLWRDERRKTECRQYAQANLDTTVTDQLRGSRSSTFVRQQLHNHRVHARYARAVERQQPALEEYQLATPTHHARREDGVIIVTKGKLESEQAARASSEPMEALKSQKQVDSAMKSGHLIGSTALRPTNPNAQVLPWTGEQPFKKRLLPPNRRDRGVPQIPYLAEDGEENDGADEVNELPHAERVSDGSKLSRNTMSTGLHYRLGTLLAEPSPQKPPLASGKAGKPFTSPNGPDIPRAQSFAYDLSRSTSSPKISEKASWTADHEVLQLSIHNSRLLDSTTRLQHGRFGYPTPTTSTAKPTPVQHLPVVEAPGVVLADDEPLRARPLRRLRLNDFKVNPASNQGYNYAFDEVVRSRDQRKCLPNCTRPECCGTKFEKFVELGGFVTPRNPGLWSSSPVDEAEEEARLLEEYLGHDHTRISRLAKDEKRQLVIQAKANQFANEHGRHRQAYGRNTSPPGFWRTDMPTTQELEEDREAAQQMTRRKLEERYREAMRPAGRWMFRDE